MKLKPQPFGSASHIETFDLKETPHRRAAFGALECQITKIYCLECMPQQVSSFCNVRRRFFSTSACSIASCIILLIASAQIPDHVIPAAERD